MPRSKAKYHPSTIMGGEPGDGDEWNEPTDTDVEDEEDNEPPRKADTRMDAMEAELTRLREENSLIKRAIPPAEPLQDEPMDDLDNLSTEDFDALLFSNPREALRLNNEKLKRELRSEYTSNQGTTKFWDQFYEANADLKGDDDLVQSTLQKNMNELGNLPVSEAMARLAALTRDRIMGYMKKRKEPRSSRAVAEGANAPAGRGYVPDDDDGPKPATMSDMLKARRQRRRAAAA